MRSVRMFLAVLAAGLLVGAGADMAMAQTTQAYHGSAGPAVSYPPDYYGIQSLKGFASEGQAGGYVGYPSDYSNTPSTNGWIHEGSAAPQKTTPSPPTVKVKGTEGPDNRTS